MNNKYLYIVSFEKDKVSIGRESNNDIVIADISVSHLHSVITKFGYNVYIEDCISKFGTLILVQAPRMKILESHPLVIQVGKIFFSLALKKESCICCGVEEIDYSKSYSQLNSKYVRKSKNIVIKEDYDNDDAIKVKDNNNKAKLTDIQIKKIN